MVWANGSCRPGAGKVYSTEMYTRLIMLVLSQGSMFHVTAGSHPVQEAGGGGVTKSSVQGRGVTRCAVKGGRG